VIINAEARGRTAGLWLVVWKSNRLLIPEASITVRRMKGPAGENGKATFLALWLMLRGDVPTSPYLTRLLSFSPRDLRALLFGGDGVTEGEIGGGVGGGGDNVDDPAVLTVLLYTLCPENAIEMSHLLSTC